MPVVSDMGWEVSGAILGTIKTGAVFVIILKVELWEAWLEMHLKSQLEESTLVLPPVV